MDPATIREMLGEAERLHLAGDCPGAIAIYDRIFAVAPGNSKMWYNRGIFHRDAEHWPEALADAEAALTHGPGELRAHVLKAEALAEMGRIQEALQILDQLIADHSGFPPPYKLRGQILWDCGFPNEAEVSLSSYIHLKPEDFGGYSLRGLARKAREAFPEAISDFTQAITLEPNHGLSRFWRSECYRAIGEESMADADGRAHIEIIRRKIADE